MDQEVDNEVDEEANKVVKEVDEEANKVVTAWKSHKRRFTL